MSSNLTKYTSTNPIQRYLITIFLNRVSTLYGMVAADSLLEVGTGEGFVLEHLSKKKLLPKTVTGIDVSEEAIHHAKSKALPVTFEVGSALSLPYADDSFDTVICLEVLEHIDDYQKALSEIMRVSKQHILLSVPWEPWFSYANALRGKNIKRLGRDPEHVNAWSKKQFSRFISDTSFTITTHVIQFPWQIVILTRS